MISNNRTQKDPFLKIILLVLILFASAHITRIAQAQNEVDSPDRVNEDGPTITASGTFSENMSAGDKPMGTSFELTADYSTGTISGTLKGSRTLTPGGWMNCYELSNPEHELDRIDVNRTETYEASFSGSIDKETGEFNISITPIGETSATKVSLFTHEDCLFRNSEKWPGEGGWNGSGTISGGVSKDGGITFSTNWTYSWFFGEVQVNGDWSGSGSVSPPPVEENEGGDITEDEPETSPIESPPEEEETEDEAASEIEPEVPSLISSLESFLRSAGLSNIDPARLAVAGTGVSALIAIWMIVNHRAGVPMEKLEQAAGQWRWREGGALPESHPEVETSPDTPPDNLPETEEGKVESKPPTSLPEQEDLEEGASATASAEFDDPTSQDTIADSPPSTDKKPSGETGEEWLERQVDDAEDYRAAVDKTIADFKKRLEDVPKEVKEGKFWKEKVAPKLKKLDDLGIESKSSKLKEYLRITKELLEVRKKVDADLSILSEKDREGIVWLERGLQGGEEALKKLHNTLITDPAIKAAKAVLPKDQAAAAEKILKQHQADIENMLSGIKKLPRKFAENAAKAQHRDQNVGIIKKDTYKVFQHEGFKDKYPPDFGKGWDKAKNAYKVVSEKAAGVKKWLGKYIWQLRDVPPAP